MKTNNLKPRIVAIGGGTGLPVLLRGLKHHPVEITAIVTVADDGGSSGRLRKELNIPPPGDIRNVLAALSDTEPLLEKLLQYRFTQGKGLSGHSLGNLLLAALKEVTGDFPLAVKELSRVLAVKGDVLPASGQAITLVGEMEDGTVITGESRIPRSGKRIKRVSIEPPDVAALPDAIAAIECAELVVIGPGSLYTSVLPNLLVKGIHDALEKLNRPKVYICNLMTQPGETDHFNASQHLQVIEQHVGKKVINTVVVNNGYIPLFIREKYLKEGAVPVEPSVSQLKTMGYDVIEGAYSQVDKYLRHHTYRLSETLMGLLTREN